MLQFLNMTAFTVLPGNPLQLGATLTAEGVNFSVFSRNAERVFLCFFKTAQDGMPFETIELNPETNKTGDIWHALISGATEGLLYLYRLEGIHNPEKGLRFDSSRYLLDPYAKAITNNSVFKYFNSSPTRETDALYIPNREVSDISLFPKCVVVDDAFDWEGDKPINRPLTDTVIYETHLRGYTKSETSKVSAPGTYKGFIEKIPYLKDLGITAVEFMPLFEFDENENFNVNPKTGEKLKNYWGYSTIGFFAPKVNYAFDTTPGACVKEFKELVKAMHKAGLEVILDVVYNHTAEGNENGYTFSFKGFQNDVYYMLEYDKRYYKNFSGCGNTLNANHPVVRKFILDSLRYWVLEMHVDGFRFDLASALCRDRNGFVTDNPPLTEAIEQDPILAKTKIIAEPWDAGGGYHVGHFPGSRWSEWNDKFRDDVKKFIRGDEYLSTAAATRLAGSSDLYCSSGKRPYNSINFVTCHDGFTMNDLVSYNNKHNEENGECNRDGNDSNNSYNNGFEGECTNVRIEESRYRTIKNFFASILLARGTPMLLAGDEFRKTQNGNNNAYCQDSPISWVDWTLVEKNKMLVRFVSILIRLRKENAIFCAPHFFGETEEEKQSGVNISWHNIDATLPDWRNMNRFLACRLFGSRVKNKDGKMGSDFYIAINTDNHDVTIIIPSLPSDKAWFRVLDTSFEPGKDICSPGDEGILSSQKKYVLPADSFVVLQTKAVN